MTSNDIPDGIYGDSDNADELPDELDDEKKPADSEFARMLEESFKGGKRKLSVGDKIRGEILVLGKEDVFVSTGTMGDGLVSRRELLDMDGADGKLPYKVGDTLDLFVTQVRGNEIHLSPKSTSKNFADDIQDAYDMKLPVEGRVVELVKGGVRVQVLGKLAFCPISQLDTRRVETGEEYVGKKLSFRITQLSEGGRNVIVSRRKLLEEERGATAGSFATEHKAGDVITGRVSRLEKFGAFIEVSPGVDGLAHISELSWSRVNDPAEAVQVGQELPVKILKIEMEGDRLRVSLSIKQAEGTPWERFPEEIQTGHVMTGKVTRCMKFGAFVELVPGIEGLIPLAEMSYDKRAMCAEDFVQEGEAVSVMVKDVDMGVRRISLSLRDAAGVDPWSLVAQKYPVGTIVTGKVERRELYGLFIRLDEGVTGLLPKSKTHDYPDFPYDKLKIGQTVEIQVDELRMGERRMSLGVPKDPNSDEWKNYVSTGASRESPQKSGFGSLGDKLREALDQKNAQKDVQKNVQKNVKKPEKKQGA